MYTILLNEDKSLIATKTEAIMQGSNLADKVVFLVPQTLGDNEMEEFTTVLIEYISPISKTYHMEFLVMSDETYNGYLQYEFPVKTDITNEAGSVELQLTFYKTDLDADGNKQQYVIKTSAFVMNVIPIAAWSTSITSDTLLPVDAKIQTLIALANQLAEMQTQIEARLNSLEQADNNETNE